MNKVFKVIWSEARNAYVVVSEIAKNHGSKSCSTKKLLTMLIATGVMTCASMAPAMAGNPAPDDLNVTIGNGAHISVWNGSTGQNINGDIAVGPNAHAWNGEYSYTDPFSKRVYPRIGSKEYLMDFGQGAVENVIDLSIKPHYKVVDGSKIAGSIAIGKNTIARTGSVMLGDHSYTGKLGDVEINPKDAMTYNDGIYSTTLGAGAYNSGSLAAVTGALSIASGKKDKDTQNTGATIYGSLNSIESATNDSNYSGVASSVLGFANRTQNANAALIWGTGNEVTNSIEDVKGIDFKKWSLQSVSDAQKDAIEAMQSSKYAGGSVLAIGGGNKADYAKYSQLTGVQNKVTGTKSENAKYDFVNGYQNIVKDASDVTVIGTKNEVTADGNKVIGDNHQVSGKNNVIFGSVKELTETTVNNAVVLGYNAKVTGEGGVVLGYNAKVTGKDGVALGAGSVADRANAVSVGSSVKGNKITRQIINVAEGTEDTDAVNVSQLRKATANANKGWKLSTEGGAENQVASEATVDFSGKKDAGNYQNITVSNEGNNVKFELANELHNVTGVVNEGSKLTLGNGVAGINNGTAQMAILNDGIYLSNLKAEQKGVQIHGVAAGTADNDAVNYGQLKDVKAEALKHSTVTNGDDNITVTPEQAADGHMQYNVALKNNITLAEDDNMVSISGSKGTIWASGAVTAGSVTAGSVTMDGATATVSGLNNKTTAYEGFATTGKAATEEQLQEVATEAGKHTTLVAGDNVQVKAENTDNGLQYTVSATDTTYTEGNGIAINGDNNAISVKLKAGEGNLVVDQDGLALNKDLKGIESISNNTSKLVLKEGWAGMKNGVGASIFMVGGLTTINNKVTVDEQGKISGVADGEISADSTDAVNGSQLNAVATEAGKRTTLVAGDNVQVKEEKTDNGLKYTVSATDTTYTEGNGIAIDKDNKNAISVKLKAGEGNLVVDQDGLALNKELQGIESISNNTSKLVLREGWAGMQNGVGASVFMVGGLTTINGRVTVDEQGKVSGVAAGTADTDAVNVSQLNKVSVEAGKHSVVTEGANITVTPEQAEDGRMQYNVALKNDIALAGDNDAFVNISGSHGSIWASSSVAAGNVIMDGTTATVSGLGNTTTAYDGFANGEGKAATEEQLKEVSKVAENANQGWNLSTNDGKASKVAPGETVDFSGDKNITISNDGTNVKVKLNENIDVNSVQTNALNSKYNLSVGTMAENGIMPFFVNSTGDFYAAHNKFHVDKDGKVTATAGEIGNVVLQNGVYYGHSTLQDGSLLLTDDNGNHSYIDAKGAKLGKVTVAEDGKISGVAAGAVTADSTDAVNGSQLHAVATEASKHSKVVNGSNINVEETDLDGQKIYKVNLNKDIMLGDLTGKYVNISGTNGTIETTGYIATNDRVYADKGAKLADIDVTGNKISNGASSIVLDGSNVKVNDKVTIDQNGKISGVAAGEVSSTSTDAINGSQLHQTNENVAELDNRVTANEKAIAQNKADIATNAENIKQNATDIAQNKNDIKNLDNRVTNVEELAKKHTTVTAGDNIVVSEDTNKDGGKEYKVALDKDINLDSVTTGDTTITDKGLEIKDGPSVTKDGINAGDKKITGVADGDIKEGSTDAINGGQLHQAKADINNRIDGVENQVINNTNRINKLGSRVNKVGAGAAALAALHPMDFDPDDKLTFSAGYGNYAGENAAAIGAYYRPDEKVMFSVAGTVGNGENMVNAGVSFALDRTNHVSNSRTALAREVIDLRGQLAVMGAKMAKMEKAFGMLDETKTKLFPDVPANHWAYEYIAKLAGNGYIEGYPDGNFGGDRLMTRYEFAAMLYRAIENGAALEEKIIKEFEPELGRIRVDRISGEDGDRDKIERVRVNDTKGERDHYGNKLAK